MDDDWCRSMRPGRGPGGSFDDIFLISALKRLDWIDVLNQVKFGYSFGRQATSTTMKQWMFKSQMHFNFIINS